MSFLALMAPLFIDPTAATTATCDFHAEGIGKTEVLVRESRIHDATGNHHVLLEVGGARIEGRVAPIDGTPDRDVLITARDHALEGYIFGLRADGGAVFRHIPAPGSDAAETLYTGSCEGVVPYLDRWLAPGP